MQYEPTQEQIIDILAVIDTPQPKSDWEAGWTDKVRLGTAVDGSALYLCVVVTHRQTRTSTRGTAAVWWYAGTGARQCPSGAWTKRGPYTQAMTPVNELARMLRAEGVA
jgi:hypothetical protein